MNGEMICINVELAQRSYRVNVRESERTVFEDASKMIDETIRGYEAKYAYKDKQDLLAMVLLQYVTAFIKQLRFIRITTQYSRDLLGRNIFVRYIFTKFTVYK